MQSLIQEISNDIENNNSNPTIKIKLISRKEKNIEQSAIDRTISFKKNKANEISVFKQGKNNKEIITNRISFEINKDKDFKERLEDDSTIISETIPSTCVSKISSFNDILLSSNAQYTQNEYDKIDIDLSSISKTNINAFPDINYSPVPESEYYDDILKDLLSEEENLEEFKNCAYIQHQQDLDINKRAHLISFIYKMSKFFKFKNRTTFLCVQTMDRFFCKEKINHYYFVLLCICCLVISSKFNEIYYPAYKDIIYIFGKGYNYTVSQALQMESLILKSLDYNLFPVFPMCYFEIIAQKTNLSDTEYHLGNLMLDLIQFDFCLYPIKNSILAQTVFGKVLNLTRGRNFDSINILKAIFPEQNFKPDSDTINIMKKTSTIINELLRNLNSGYFVDIYEKYLSPELLGDSINYFIKE